MKYLCCILIGYLVGTVNPAFFIAKLNGFDIRERGSRNAGASNALILFGKFVGVLCALFDIAKATIVIWLMGKLFPELAYSFAVTGVACILGHIFPFYMRFRGGKGTACLAGMILAFDWRVFLIMLTIEIVIAFVSKYICFVPITAVIAFPIVYGVMRKNLWGAFILCIVTVVILFKNIENLKRIRNRTEARMSILWNKDKEIDRITK